ncbi:MAG: hypothetical protein WAK62_07720, partial [Terriglobales bacterium]
SERRRLMTSFFRRDVASFLLVIFVLCCGLIKAQSVNGTDAGSAEEQIRAREKACVLNLRSLNVAQITYWGGDDTRGFARTLKQLGPDGAGLLDAATVSGRKDGYRFRLLLGKTIGEAEPIKHYKLIAQPVKQLSSSQRSYYTDETGIIRFTEQEREPAITDPPLEPPNER